MIRAELYKLRTHRTPMACAATLLIGVLAPSVMLIWYTPADSAAYTDAFTSAFETLSLLLAIVFGGWLLGTEYRQSTVKRLLTSEPRRIRALTTKGLVGGAAMSVVLTTIAGAGWAAARVVGSMNDVTVPLDARILLAFSLSALIAAAVAFSLSAVTRSDSFAMVGTVATILVVGLPLSLIPKVGKYTFFPAITRVEQWVSGGPSETLETLSAGTAAVALAAWLVAFLTLGTVLFASRDV